MRELSLPYQHFDVERQRNIYGGPPVVRRIVKLEPLADEFADPTGSLRVEVSDPQSHMPLPVEPRDE